MYGVEGGEDGKRIPLTRDRQEERGELNASMSRILADALQDAGVADEQYLYSLRNGIADFSGKIIAQLSQIPKWASLESIRKAWDKHVNWYQAALKGKNDL